MRREKGTNAYGNIDSSSVTVTQVLLYICISFFPVNWKFQEGIREGGKKVRRQREKKVSGRWWKYDRRP
jgi:hypothetical protein